MYYYKWDVFISHASEDKDSIAIPLAQSLEKLGLKVWIDSQELEIGDSLRRKIDEGLLASRFGVLILSKHFFLKEWTQKELDALFSRDDGKEKVILPIWHDVSKEDVVRFSPLLADKIALLSNIGIKKLALKISRIVAP